MATLESIKDMLIQRGVKFEGEAIDITRSGVNKIDGCGVNQKEKDVPSKATTIDYSSCAIHKACGLNCTDQECVINKSIEKAKLIATRISIILITAFVLSVVLISGTLIRLMSNNPFDFYDSKALLVVGFVLTLVMLVIFKNKAKIIDKIMYARLNILFSILWTVMILTMPIIDICMKFIHVYIAACSMIVIYDIVDTNVTKQIKSLILSLK